MSYKLIYIDEHLKKVKENYLNNPELWYKSIIPKEKAEELKQRFHGDYSLLWHEHCSECWQRIDSNMKVCYFEEEEKEWLCPKCYNELNKA